MLKIDTDLQNKLVIFGNKLANQRKKLNLTQEELAEDIGTAQRIQSNYERGKVAPQLDYLFKLADRGFDIPKLLFQGEDQGIYVLENKEQTIIDLYRESDAETQLRVLEVLAGGAVKRQTVPENQNIALIAGKQTIKNKKT